MSDKPKWFQRLLKRDAVAAPTEAPRRASQPSAEEMARIREANERGNEANRRRFATKYGLNPDTATWSDINQAQRRSILQSRPTSPQTPTNGLGKVVIDAPTAGQGALIQRNAGMTPFVYREPVAGAQLNTNEGLASFMAGSTSTDDWNRRVMELKAHNGGQYPRNWYQAVVLSGLYQQKANELGDI